jgi:hypothetical protein
MAVVSAVAVSVGVEIALSSTGGGGVGDEAQDTSAMNRTV